MSNPRNHTTTRTSTRGYGQVDGLDRRLNQMSVSALASLVWLGVCLLLLVGFEGELSWVSVSLLALFTYSSYMLWRTVYARRIAPLALMFWLYHTNFLLLPALSQSLHGVFFWSPYKDYRMEDLLQGCALITAGLFAFQAGTYYGRRKIPVGDAYDSPRHFLELPLQANGKVQLLLLLSLGGIAGLVATWGPGMFMQLRSEDVGIETQHMMGLLMNLPRAVAIGVLLFSVCLLVQKWRQSRRLQFPVVVILLAALAVNAVVNYPLGLARFWFFGFLISLAWVITPLRTARLRAAFVVGFTAMQFTVFPWFSQITRGSGSIEMNLDAIREYLHFGDFDAFQTLVNIYLYVRDEGLEFGRNLASVALFIVPRGVWEDKAMPLGVAAAEYMDYHFTNLSAPIYGEFYVDFGLPSLALGLFLMGFMIVWFDGYYDRMVRRNSSGAGVLLTSILAGYLLILLRGSLLAVISGIATLFGYLLLASWLATRGGAHRRRYRITTVPRQRWRQEPQHSETYAGGEGK